MAHGTPYARVSARLAALFRPKIPSATRQPGPRHAGKVKGAERARCALWLSTFFLVLPALLLPSPAWAEFPATIRFRVLHPDGGVNDGPLKDTEYEACIAFMAQHGRTFGDVSFVNGFGNFLCRTAKLESFGGRAVPICPPTPPAR
jgi:hypothetical protein